MNRLVTAWLILIALSAVSTLMTLGLINGAAAGVILLVLAWFKARLILGDYLGLRAAPFWRRGFGLVLAVYAAGLLGLYMAG
jgi:hypothetical protein